MIMNIMLGILLLSVLSYYLIYLGYIKDKADWTSYIGRLIQRMQENKLRFIPFATYVFATVLVGMISSGQVNFTTNEMGLLIQHTAFFLFQAVSKTVAIMAMSYAMMDDPGRMMASVMVENPVYRFYVYVAFMLSMISAFLFISSLLWLHLRDRFSYRVWSNARRRLLLIGDNAENQRILLSRGEEHYYGIIALQNGVDSGSKADRDPEIAYAPESAEIILHNILKKIFNGKNKSENTVIVNTHNDTTNLDICRLAAEKLQIAFYEKQKVHDQLLNPAGKDPDRIKKDREEAFLIEREITEKLSQIRIIVFVHEANRDLFTELENHSFGVLVPISKYRLTAMNFVWEHPLTELFTGRYKDYLHEDGTVDEDLSLGVLLLGFGDTNRQILSMSAAVNQFICKKPGELPVHKPVTYHIFDTSPEAKNEYLNNTFFRYSRDFRAGLKKGLYKEENYLPLPPNPCIVEYHPGVDVVEGAFTEEATRILVQNPKSLYQVIVAIGSDLDNLVLAQRLSVRLKLEHMENVTVYAKERNTLRQPFRFPDQNLNMPVAYFVSVCNEALLAWNLSSILHEEVTQMSRFRHAMYEEEQSILSGNEFPGDEESKKIHAVYSWLTCGSEKRYANIYAMLALRFKLNLCGLDIKRTRGMGQVVKSNDEYFARYAKDDVPSVYLKTECGRILYDYSKPESIDSFKSGLLRRNMAVQEHLRFTASMLINGFVPATFDEIRSGTSSNYVLRTHAKLTTFEGLFQYQNFLESELHENETMANLVIYDFQQMDEAWWMLSSMDYEMLDMRAQKEESGPGSLKEKDSLQPS